MIRNKEHSLAADKHNTEGIHDTKPINRAKYTKIKKLALFYGETNCRGRAMIACHD